MNIEELAFKDRKILANLNAVDLLNIIEFLQDDRRQCLEELSKTHNRSVEIQKENQELKSILRGTTHCFDEEEHNKLKEENQTLKKQLENKYEKVGTLTGELLYEENTKLINQQKAFINYLESWKENEEYCYLASNPIDRCRKDIYEEVLQKYKSIIGDDK